jgi:hypothetical protein
VWEGRWEEEWGGGEGGSVVQRGEAKKQGAAAAPPGRMVRVLVSTGRSREGTTRGGGPGLQQL